MTLLPVCLAALVIFAAIRVADRDAARNPGPDACPSPGLRGTPRDQLVAPDTTIRERGRASHPLT